MIRGLYGSQASARSVGAFFFRDWAGGPMGDAGAADAADAANPDRKLAVNVSC